MLLIGYILFFSFVSIKVRALLQIGCYYNVIVRLISDINIIPLLTISKQRRMKSRKQIANRKEKNLIYLGPIIFLGLIGALTLQSIWLYNTYILIKGNIQKECNAIIEKALQEEGNIRFGKTPKGTEILSGPTNDTIPSMTYFYERLSNM